MKCSSEIYINDVKEVTKNIDKETNRLNIETRCIICGESILILSKRLVGGEDSGNKKADS